ncbi:MAG: methylated-DNA--[protein]-cysteine S-methyltransferase [Candidatus Cloacimonetes bacterium]|nr:methylated-DNA--[protein]-cysteine S-methyltransferase [Candidatus Cloacimonadota bacterium]
MNKIHIKYLKTTVGELILGSYENMLCLTDWRYRKMRDTIDSRIKKGLNAEYLENDSEIIRKTETQINEFLKKERKEFDIDLLLVGTEFQKKVWKELMKIPFGTTKTYLDLSRNLGNEKAVRAVASANGANAIAIIVPCHRIIGSNGTLVGYAGGLSSKKRLIELERESLQLTFSNFR